MRVNYIFQGILITVLLIGFCGCKSNQGLFSKNKSDHQLYTERIEKAGLESTSLAKKWMGAATKSLKQPVSITIPYAEKGFFDQSEPRAAAFRFNIRQGELLKIEVITIVDSASLFFAELWEQKDALTTKFLAESDSSGLIRYEAKNDGILILRIQPELLQSVEYHIRLSAGPSLAFPVRITDQPKISSFWGADRDGGIRKHEGVDIFAKKKTPLIAAADGKVTRVTENNLGGKVVFIRPFDKPYSLYYAHLDSHLVEPGQEVTTGQIIGLMGNTGNARTTPSHLHFGIYGSDGAVDPFPFINQERKKPDAVTADQDNLNNYQRARTDLVLYSQPDKKSSVLSKLVTGDLVFTEAAVSDWYRIRLNDSVSAFVQDNQLTKSTWRKQILADTTTLYHRASVNAPAIVQLRKGTGINVYGKSGKFLYVGDENVKGWMEITGKHISK